MTEQKFCQSCDQHHSCQQVYQRMGDNKGPSVVFKAILAFLLPVAVFIGALAVFQAILAKTAVSKPLQTALSFLLALSAAFILILIIKAVNKHRCKSG